MYHVFLADDEPWALMTLKNMIEWSEYGFAVSGEYVSCFFGGR